MNLCRIPHRDICRSNLYLIREKNDDYFTDLDLAVSIKAEKVSGVPYKTDTKVSMAIGALYVEDYELFHA